MAFYVDFKCMRLLPTHTHTHTTITDNNSKVEQRMSEKICQKKTNEDSTNKHDLIFMQKRFLLLHWLFPSVRVKPYTTRMQTINSETPFLWRSRPVTSLGSYGEPIEPWRDPLPWPYWADTESRLHSSDLKRSPRKHTLVTRWIHRRDLTVTMDTDHNDLYGFTVVLLEALFCKSHNHD